MVYYKIFTKTCNECKFNVHIISLTVTVGLFKCHVNWLYSAVRSFIIRSVARIFGLNNFQQD